MKTSTKTLDHTSPANRQDNTPPADWQADADLWKLLGTMPRAELSPGFDDVVFRGIARLERPNPEANPLLRFEEVIHIFLRRVALPLAAAAMVAAALVALNRPTASIPVENHASTESFEAAPAEFAGETSTTEEFDLVANLHNIITADENDSWLVASMDFNDETL